MGTSTKYAIEHNVRASNNKASQEKSQRQRFIETARELGCDESEEAFDEALRKVAKAKAPPPKPVKKPNE